MLVTCGMCARIQNNPRGNRFIFRPPADEHRCCVIMEHYGRRSREKKYDENK